ncbi:hypothetical protein [Nocardia sp. NPDC050412]|uniref:hypothetical protein n=1 Tax=Nocardia sp. NPDC050412 TaxID=3364320 RepID=UPI00378A96CD
MSTEAMTLPTSESLVEAIKGGSTDAPVCAAVTAMSQLHQRRFLSLAILADHHNPADAAAMLQAAGQLATAVSGTARCIRVIDQHIAASVRLDPSPDAEVAAYTVGEFAAAIGYVAVVAYAERKAGRGGGNEARLAGLFDAYDEFRAALLSGTSRLPLRTPSRRHVECEPEQGES